MTTPNGSTITRSGGLPGQVWMNGFGWVQPIRDSKGNVLYYSDPVSGQRVSGHSAGPGSGQTYDTRAEATKAADARTKRQDATTGQYPQGTAAAPRAGERFVYIDGHQATVVVDANGNWTVNYTDGTKTGHLTPPSAFGALDEIDPSAPFVMSNYQLGPSTKKVGLGNVLGQLGQKVANGGRNLMTVEGGVQWLANLANKDHEAYDAMAQKLISAGYLTQADYLAAGGGYSNKVGKAFADAASELAVVNATPDGTNTTLDDWLQSKIAGGAGAGTTYQPVQRSYTDPEDLKAAAVSTAEKNLGRRLTPEEESQLVAHYRGMEDAAYNAQDAAGRQGQNATFTSPGQGEVDAFVGSGPREQESANWRTAQYGEALKQLFSQTTNLA